MSFKLYHQNTPLNFNDQNNFQAERIILDNNVHDIIKNYGIDVLYVSQKKNYPIIPTEKTPTDQELLFHAYGDIIKPEFNPPFLTRAYIKFDNDLFAIDQFGLSNDMAITAFFNKLDFAFDGALEIAGRKTITRKFNFRTVINLDRRNYTISFNDKSVDFTIDIPFPENKVDPIEDVYRVEGTLVNFEFDPGREGNKYLYATYHKRYSANSYVEDSKISVSYKTQNVHTGLNQVDIVGTVNCSFSIKDPFEAYTKYERRITPAVGDLLFIKTVDNKFEKLEIAEVVAENKTVSGINPLMGTYSYQCACKPFIADNASILGELDGPTDLNAFKLDNIESLNEGASMTAGELSRYAHLHNIKQPNLYNIPSAIQQDEVYGGYDADIARNSRDIQIENNDPATTLWHYYTWDESFADIDITIDIPGAAFSYSFSPDELYHRLSNLFDSEYTESVIKHEGLEINPIDYSMFNLTAAGNSYLEALNCTFYDINKVLYNNTPDAPGSTQGESDIGRGYLAKHIMLKLIAKNPTLFNTFYNTNKTFIDHINSNSYYKGFKSTYNLPLINLDFRNTYIGLINAKKLTNPVKIEAVEFKITTTEPELVLEKTPEKVKIIVDLQDIEEANINTKDFNLMLQANNKIKGKVEADPAAKLSLTFIDKGDLITVYEFGDEQDSRLATNGIELYVETHDSVGNIFRYSLSNPPDDYSRIKYDGIENAGDLSSGVYSGPSVKLDGTLGWLTADQYGIYFNSFKDDKSFVLVGDRSKFHTLKRKSRLSFSNNIKSEPLSSLITFAGSDYYLKLTNSLDDVRTNKDDNKCYYLYVEDKLTIENLEAAGILT